MLIVFKYLVRTGGWPNDHTWSSRGGEYGGSQNIITGYLNSPLQFNSVELSGVCQLYLSTSRHRAYFKRVKILLPKSWSSVPAAPATDETFETAEIVVDEANSAYGNNPYTVQVLKYFLNKWLAVLQFWLNRLVSAESPETKRTLLLGSLTTTTMELLTFLEKRRRWDYQ